MVYLGYGIAKLLYIFYFLKFTPVCKRMNRILDKTFVPRRRYCKGLVATSFSAVGK